MNNDEKEPIKVENVEESDEKIGQVQKISGTMFHFAILEMLIVLSILVICSIIAIKLYGRKIQNIFGANKHCIAEHTMVLTASGLEPVEDITVGCRVLSRDDEGGIQTARVVWKGRFVTENYLRISFIDGRTLKCTPSHPIATLSGWVKSGQLRTGDEVLTRAGQVEIDAINTVSKTITVFDLEVEPLHTYFANGILVHNKSMDSIPPDHLPTR